jgi:hypothetical protein
MIGASFRSEGHETLPAMLADHVVELLANGVCKMLTVEGEKFCRPGDWVVLTPSGPAVISSQVFEALLPMLSYG